MPCRWRSCATACAPLPWAPATPDALSLPYLPIQSDVQGRRPAGHLRPRRRVPGRLPGGARRRSAAATARRRWRRCAPSRAPRWIATASCFVWFRDSTRRHRRRRPIRRAAAHPTLKPTPAHGRRRPLRRPRAGRGDREPADATGRRPRRRRVTGATGQLIARGGTPMSRDSEPPRRDAAVTALVALLLHVLPLPDAARRSFRPAFARAGASSTGR